MDWRIYGFFLVLVSACLDACSLISLRLAPARRFVFPLPVSSLLAIWVVIKCEIHHRRNAGEILHQYTRRAIRDFAIGMRMFKPARQRLDILKRDGLAILPAQQVLE